MVELRLLFALRLVPSSMARTRGFQLRVDPSKPRPTQAAVAGEYRAFIANFVRQRTAHAKRNEASSRSATAGTLGSNAKVAASPPSTKTAALPTQPQAPARKTRPAAAAATLANNAAAKPKKVSAKKAAPKKPAAKKV
jgi:hypothetical protein